LLVSRFILVVDVVEFRVRQMRDFHGAAEYNNPIEQSQAFRRLQTCIGLLILEHMIVINPGYDAVR